MTTPWAFPSTITQYTEPGTDEIFVSWDDSDEFRQIKQQDGRALQSVGALEHIARSPKHDLKNKTYYLKATNFNFQYIPDAISGIELKIVARRYGRVVDDTVQLLVNDVISGENKATLEIKPEKIYGGEFDLWSIDSITKTDLESVEFGVVIRFKAHPDWPHKDPVLIDSVEMRIH